MCTLAFDAALRSSVRVFRKQVAKHWHFRAALIGEETRERLRDCKHRMHRGRPAARRVAHVSRRRWPPSDTSRPEFGVAAASLRFLSCSQQKQFGRRVNCDRQLRQSRWAKRKKGCDAGQEALSHSPVKHFLHMDTAPALCLCCYENSPAKKEPHLSNWCTGARDESC